MRDSYFYSGRSLVAPSVPLDVPAIAATVPATARGTVHGLPGCKPGIPMGKRRGSRTSSAVESGAQALEVRDVLDPVDASAQLQDAVEGHEARRPVRLQGDGVVVGVQMDAGLEG